MGRRLHLLRNADVLDRQLGNLWQEISQKTIRVLYHSIPRRVTVVQQPMRVKVYCAKSVYESLGPAVHGQMFRSGNQFDTKPSVLSSRASLVLIYEPTENSSHSS
ncbi:hypothetical protein TNCV_5054991 [Trichonephila clavipes]|nr:hypothetical protein TNCV_5054991 [Trichonephila clavipes]